MKSNTRIFVVEDVFKLVTLILLSFLMSKAKVKVLLSLKRTLRV
jgi:hypothetical protein